MPRPQELLGNRRMRAPRPCTNGRTPNYLRGYLTYRLVHSRHNSLATADSDQSLNSIALYVRFQGAEKGCEIESSENKRRAPKMQSGYRTFSCASAFAALVLFAAISGGSAQFRCFTTPSSAGELNCGTADGEFEAASIEECCLGPNGQFFEPRAGSEGCTACIVFGWFDGAAITLDERTETYELTAGFVKGGAVQTFVTAQGLAAFNIAVEESGAVEGVNEDFVVQDSTHQLFGANPDPFDVPFTVRLDGIALEPAEGFTLSLDPTNPTATDILTEEQPGLFVIPEISVVIRDLENATLQFTEVDYANPEAQNVIQPQLQLSTTIAVDLVVEVIPLNLTFARDSGQLPPSLDPIQTDPNFDPNTQTATSVADFSVMPVRVTFASGRSPETILFGIGITDDTIHEADQIFVLRLEVVSGADRNRLVPERTDGLTSLGRIIDDDTIPIGFEQERYTVSEANDTLGDLIPIPIIKGNNLQSELEFEVIAQFIDDTATRLTDYLVVARIVIPFLPNDQSIQVQFLLLQDRLPEPNEEFTIELTTSGAPRVVVGQDGGPFARTTVVIIDDDVLTIGWERNLTTVNENQGSLQLCLNITDVNEFDDITGFSVMLFIGTIRGTAADPGDYIERRADSTFVTISDEDRGACIDVVINDDILLEEVEFFSVQIVPPDGLSPNIRLIPDITFVEILDNDFVRIGFNQTTYDVTEGEDAVATVYVAVLEGGLQRMVSVTFSTEVLGGDTATAGDDFDSVTRVLVFDESTLVVPVDIPIIDDTIVEFPETFTVSLVRDPEDPINEVIIRPDTATVSILDNEIVRCLDPPPIVNGMRTFTGNLVGDTATYTCDPGFELIGEPTTTCTESVDGNSATYPGVPPPECRPVCLDPPMIENGMRTFTGNSIGDTATYTCNPGFELIGDPTTTCTAAVDGNSATYPAVPPPECRPLCADPPIIVNGMRTFSGNSVSDTAIYSCDPGFELIGESTTTCTIALDGNSATYPGVPPPECRPLCDDPPPIVNGMRTFTGNSVGDTATYTCNPGFQLIGDPTTTCTAAVDGNSATYPGVPPPECSPIDGIIKVNDTVIGDPLFAVPLNVRDLESLDLDTDRISLCYEIHGEANQWFNFVTDECTSVNAHYIGIVGGELNVISQIAIRAVDADSNCREILVNLENCSVELDGMAINGSRYSENEITIRRFTMVRRVRVTVPNCQEQSLVMWITCQTRTTKSPVSNNLITFDSIRFDVMRGLNFGHRDSHGIIGQFWNVPIQLSPFTGTRRDGTAVPDDYIVTVERAGSPQREFVGHLGRRTWDRSLVPCLYSGNRQAGPIYEVTDPNDPVIEGNYRSYRVPSAFDETGYQFGRFEESQC